MTDVCLSFGSNHGNRKENVEKALEEISRYFKCFHASSIYETPEIHGRGESYYNAVATGLTELDYSSLNSFLKSYEISQGRDERARKKGEVVIDIDIVLWENEIMRPNDFEREFFQIGFRSIRTSMPFYKDITL